MRHRLSPMTGRANSCYLTVRLGFSVAGLTSFKQSFKAKSWKVSSMVEFSSPLSIMDMIQIRLANLTSMYKDVTSNWMIYKLIPPYYTAYLPIWKRFI